MEPTATPGVVTYLLEGHHVDRPFGEHHLRRGQQGFHGALFTRIQAALRCGLHDTDRTAPICCLEKIAIEAA